MIAGSYPFAWSGHKLIFQVFPLGSLKLIKKTSVNPHLLTPAVCSELYLDWRYSTAVVWKHFLICKQTVTPPRAAGSHWTYTWPSVYTLLKRIRCGLHPLMHQWLLEQCDRERQLRFSGKTQGLELGELGSSPSFATEWLCSLEQVTCPLWAIIWDRLSLSNRRAVMS